jgi:hypothetical protein
VFDPDPAATGRFMVHRLRVRMAETKQPSPLSRIMLAWGHRSLPVLIGQYLLKMAAGFNPGRLTMFLGLLMSASPILMLTCKDGLSTTTAKPKPPAPSMLTKHKAPEAGRWPAREQLPDVPAIPALAPRRNYLRLKPIMGRRRATGGKLPVILRRITKTEASVI